MISTDCSFPKSHAVLERLVVVEECVSTNSEILNHLPLAAFSGVLTLKQTGGRGRLDRRWVAKPGESVALSVVVPPLTQFIDRPSQTLWIPLLVGYCVVNALREIGVTKAVAKWPNDALVDGKKIAGVLCEKVSSELSVAGVGVNLVFENLSPSSNATSLDEHIDVSSSTADELIYQFVRELRQSWVLPEGSVRKKVQSTMATLGREVVVEEAHGKKWSGLALGLHSTGNLQVRDDSGQVKLVNVGDINHLYQ